MSVEGAHGNYTYIILSEFTHIRELRRLQPNEGLAISNDSYRNELFDWTIIILPDIVLYFLVTLRNFS